MSRFILTFLIVISMASCVHHSGCVDIQGNKVACLKAFNDKALRSRV